MRIALALPFDSNCIQINDPKTNPFSLNRQICIPLRFFPPDPVLIALALSFLTRTFLIKK